MYRVNRDLVIIKGKQPLVDWINSIDPDHPVDISGVRDECNVLLIQENFGPDGAMEEVEANYANIFEQELFGWYEDEAVWPQNRTLSLFRDWFEIEYHSTVLDVLDEPIVKRLD